MSENVNHLGQTIGFPVENWQGCDAPPRNAMEGTYCRLEPLDLARHAAELYAANSASPDDRYWTYLPYGPFGDEAAYRRWLEESCLGDDPLFHAIIDLESGQAVGIASYLRITPAQGVIEVGHIHYSPLLQRRPAATEAMYLMMRRVFDELGYRRYEWKCNALNAGSRAAAERFGFQFEGIFRQHLVVKGGNRDSAWFSILDREWPGVKAAYETWLAPENFDAEGKQRQSLTALMQGVRE